MTNDETKDALTRSVERFGKIIDAIQKLVNDAREEHGRMRILLKQDVPVLDSAPIKELVHKARTVHIGPGEQLGRNVTEALIAGGITTVGIFREKVRSDMPTSKHEPEWVTVLKLSRRGKELLRHMAHL